MSKDTEKETMTEKKTVERELQSDKNKETPEQEKAEDKKKGMHPDKKKSHEKESQKLKEEVNELKDKYLRLYSEFENYRRRTAREKMELIGTANEELMLEILPVIDDFERALDSIPGDKTDVSSVKDGVQLIYNKLKNITEKKGLRKMELKPGDEFNPEIHDAVSQIPATDKKLKGKVVDTIEKGYYLNDKVIRFAKVVIGT